MQNDERDDTAKSLGITSTTKKVRRVLLMPHGLKNTRVIEKKVSLARVPGLEDHDEAEEDLPPRARRR